MSARAAVAATILLVAALAGCEPAGLDENAPLATSTASPPSLDAPASRRPQESVDCSRLAYNDRRIVRERVDQVCKPGTDPDVTPGGPDLDINPDLRPGGAKGPIQTGKRLAEEVECKDERERQVAAALRQKCKGE